MKDDGARMQTGDASDSLTASTNEQRVPVTPGPWHVEMCNGSVEDIIGADGTHVVCFDHDYDDYGYMTEADARLCAAAPDLLAALKVITDAKMVWIGAQDILAQAKDAIAKAEGR